MNMKKENFSNLVLDSIRKALNADQNIVEVLVDTLKISVDAAYRRINGKVSLTLEEAIKLCQNFKISIDGVASINSEKLLFDYFALFSEHYTSSYNKYLLSLETALNEVIACKGKFYVAASDIPIGFIFRYPKLMAFKSYCWKNEMMISDNHEPFSLDIDPGPFQNFFSRFAKLYATIDSYEIWCTYTFESFIDTLKFYNDIEMIPVKELSILVNELQNLINDLEEFSRKGEKDAGGNLFLYIAPLNLSNSIFLLEKQDSMISFLKMYAINSIWTTNSLYCSEQKKWFEAMIDSSTLISGSNLKERKKYFDSIRLKINAI